MEKFTKEEDEKLVEAVSKYPPIYNPQNKDYKDINIKDAIWAEISQLVGRNGDDCKRRFKNLRDSYMRNKKVRKVGTGSSTNEKPTKWYLAPFLSFLDHVPQERNSASNICIDNESQDNHNSNDDGEFEEDDDNSSEVSAYPQILSQNTTKIGYKRKQITDIFEKRSKERMDLLNKLSTSTSTPKEPDDSVDMFFKSIALTVKTFSPNQIAQAKLKIMTYITQLEIQNLNTATENKSQTNSILQNHSEMAPTSSSSHYKNSPATISKHQGEIYIRFNSTTEFTFYAKYNITTF